VLGVQSEEIASVFVLGTMVDDTGRLTTKVSGRVTSNINHVTRLHAKKLTKSPRIREWTTKATFD
jgi:hypothetical protein